MNVGFANPPRPDCWLPRTARIAAIRAETPGVRTYELKLGDDFRFSPGQFNMLYVPGVGEAAISISSSARDPDALAHTVREVGDVTAALARHAVGDQIALRGPFGNPWPVDQAGGHDVMLVAGGIGLAPLRPVVYEFLSRRSSFGRLSLIYGARTPKDLLFAREYDAWRSAGIDVYTTVDRADLAWTGNIGVVTDLMHRAPLSPERASILTCGPEIMMRAVVREALGLGFDIGRIFVSLERNMKCAVAMCGHCQLGPEFLCQDGPVFPYPRVAPYMRLEDL